MVAKFCINLIEGCDKKYHQGFKWFQHVSTIRLVVQDFATIHSMTQPSFEPKNWTFDMV